MKTFTVLKSKHGLHKYEITTYVNNVLTMTTTHKDEVTVMLRKAFLVGEGYTLTIEGDKPTLIIEKETEEENEL